MDTWWNERQEQTLRTGSVMPLPLMVETNWAPVGWEVSVVLITDVVSNGYSSVDIWTHREPYANGRTDGDEADRVTVAAMTAFGARLRAVLAQD